MSDEQQEANDDKEIVKADPATSPQDAEKDEPSGAETKRGKGKLIATLVVVVLAAIGALYAWKTFAPADATTAARDTAQTAAPTPTLSPIAKGDIIQSASLADIDNLQRDIARINDRLGALSDQLQKAEQQVASQSGTTQSLQADMQRSVDLLDSIPGRVRNTEEALVTLQGISAGSRNAWLTAEAEYYLQIANAQVQLANNPELAAAALELGDQRVRELADPAYTAVRRQIATELATLKAIDSSDVEGVTLTLGSLSAMVPSLPLAREITRIGRDEDSDDPSLAGWARVKQSTSNFFASMVRIRETNERVEPMLSPDAEYFLRLNLQLQLQAARLSLLLGESASYQQTLQDAESWLTQYFDGNSTAVKAALEMIEGAKDTSLVSERPDIAGSLRLLRQLREVGTISE